MVRISRFFAGGIVSATLAVALSGCTGTPALTVYGELVDRCVETHASSNGYMALLGSTVVNTTSRSVILREYRPTELVNATIDEVSVVRLASPETGFGVAPGGILSLEQRQQWLHREPFAGTVIGPHEAVSLVVHLRATDYRHYAGIRGIQIRYDDGWFSATSVGYGVTGFVAPWAHCSDAR